MRRTSTRAPPVTYTDPPSDLDADEFSLTEDDAPRRKKRTKKRAAVDRDDEKEAGPAKRPRRKRGLLKDLVEMPMDILFEIFAQLDPLDLVHVSRTTKAFRAVLMHRSSKSIWRSARSHIEGLPDCPDDLSEPQYAVLLFSKYCSFCFKTKATYTSWAARIRTCNKCLNLHFEPCYYNYTVPRGYPSELARWLPLLEVTRQRGRRQETTWLFSVKVDDKWGEDYKNLSVIPQMRIEWIQEQLNKHYAVEEHARECEFWHMIYHSSDDSSSENKLKIARDKILIKDYIKELGYEEEFYKIPPAVPQPLEDEYIEDALRCGLSPEALLERIKSQLTSRMEELKRRRKESEFTQILHARKQFLIELRIHGARELPKNTHIPSISDIHEVAEKHNCIDYSKMPDSALSVPFTEIVSLWKSSIDTQLIELIKATRSSNYDFNPTTVLDLATTSFDCQGSRWESTSCRAKSMRPGRAAVHSCNIKEFTSSSDEKRERGLLEVFGANSRFSSQARSVLEFSNNNRELIAELVRMVGLDPATATATEMDALNAIFECTTCNNIDEGRVTMTWDAVRGHKQTAHAYAHSDKDRMKLQILSGSDAKTVRKRILEEQIRAAHIKPGGLVCVHCLEIVPNIKGYREHLKKKHAITEIVKYENVVFSQDADRIPPVFKLWPPLHADSEGTQNLSKSDSSSEPADDLEPYF